MKKPKIAGAEKPTLVSKAEDPITTVATEEAKKPVVQKSSKPKAEATKVANDAKAGQPIASVVTEAKPKQASAIQKPANKPTAEGCGQNKISIRESASTSPCLSRHERSTLRFYRR